ncbi:hypothetical protein DPMN_001497 [Dreissena polymorpha]|uniref:Uncharacterized protein n=1 Tax=Dreissena polymorpha TaxID=45954 RepID=A0A9D4RT38_DREPO|nr:hypothetical protein DPMN_001497 [Dreissena polymorpha]
MDTPCGKRLELWSSTTGLGKALYGPLVRRQRARPVGSDYDAMKQPRSHHRRAVLDQHCSPTIKRVFRD